MMIKRSLLTYILYYIISIQCVYSFFFFLDYVLSFFFLADHFPITYEDGLHESSYIYVHTTCVFGYFYKYHVIDSSQPSSLLCLKC
jgi:hypothetical protein